MDYQGIDQCMLIFKTRANHNAIDISPLDTAWVATLAQVMFLGRTGAHQGLYIFQPVKLSIRKICKEKIYFIHTSLG